MPTAAKKAAKSKPVQVEETKVTRQRKTPAERAQEALDAAGRRCKKANERVERLQVELSAAREEQLEAEDLYEYVAQNPALPKQQVEDVELPEGDEDED